MTRPDDLSSDERRLAEATKKAVIAAGGLEVCKAETRLSTSQLSRCGSKEHHDSITIRDAVMIDSIGHPSRDHPFILRAQARLLGFLLVKEPEGPEDGDGLLQSVMELTAELGDVAQAINEALRDRTVTAKEAGVVLDQLTELDEASARLRLKLKNLTDQPG